MVLPLRFLAFASLLSFSSARAQYIPMTSPALGGNGQPLTIEVWSDVVCPFCRIGKRELELAIERFPHKDSVRVVWKSFELDPEAPASTGENTFAMLQRRGVFIVPDILANAGGVTVSYFEWVQDIGFLFWSEDEVNDRLRAIMIRSFNDVLKIAQEKGVDLRTAALILAVHRVASALAIRGIYP